MNPTINFQKARFLISAPSIRECPPETGTEVAFAGRSNAGKSSAINCLTRNRKLARTSKTPGRTQLINFFSLDDTDDQRLVDLPGYGYAKVSVSVKKTWQKHLSEYLYERKSLNGLVLLMDIRHPLQDFDAMIIDWATECKMPLHILLTKADKLKRGAAKNALFAVKRELASAGVTDLVSVQTFSSLKKEGIGELEQVLNGWLALAVQTPENEEPT